VLRSNVPQSTDTEVPSSAAKVQVVSLSTQLSAELRVFPVPSVSSHPFTRQPLGVVKRRTPSQGLVKMARVVMSAGAEKTRPVLPELSSTSSAKPRSSASQMASPVSPPLPPLSPEPVSSPPEPPGAPAP
jgi:hypothetical protein